jgi:lipoprotein-releasing system permease protein
MLRGTERGTFSAMTLFAWLAIGVGVGAMSSLLSVMYGFEGALKEKVLNAYPHILVGAKESLKPIPPSVEMESKIRALPKVSKILPYIQNEMILQTDKKSVGAVIWGLPNKSMKELKFKLREGKWPEDLGQLAPVMVGSELGHRLGLIPGEQIKIISPLEKSGALGLVPQSQMGEVVGLFASGHYEFDEQYVLLVLEDAQELLGWGEGLSGWQIWVDSLEDTPKVLSAIQEILPEGLEAKSWESFNSALFQSLKLEQYSMFSILVFAILIAVMNIVITLTMNVSHKRKNIGILRALGATQKQIRRIFLWQGGFMGGVGLTLGAFLTTSFVVYVKYLSGYQLPEIYYDRTIPIEIRPISLFLIYGVATILIYFATLYPASQAAKMSTIEAIRE